MSSRSNHCIMSRLLAVSSNKQSSIVQWLAKGLKCVIVIDNQINDFVSSSLQTFLCVLDYREPSQTFVIDRGNFVDKCIQFKFTHFLQAMALFSNALRTTCDKPMETLLSIRDIYSIKQGSELPCNRNKQVGKPETSILPFHTFCKSAKPFEDKNVPHTVENLGQSLSTSG